MPNRTSVIIPSTFLRLQRLEAQFLQPHRLVMLLALGGMLVQSLLLLPIPLLQGWVLDRLVVRTILDRPIEATDQPGTVWIIATALLISIACLLGRTILGWRVTGTMI